MERMETLDTPTPVSAKNAVPETHGPLERAGVPAGPINDMADVFADPQVIARGMRIDPEGIPGVRTPIRFSDADLALDRASPRLGSSEG